jgi:hypothetical protein
VALIELIRVLDGFNRCRFRGDRKRQGEGDIARNVFGSLRSKAVESEVEGVTLRRSAGLPRPRDE